MCISNIFHQLIGLVNKFELLDKLTMKMEFSQRLEKNCQQLAQTQAFKDLYLLARIDSDDQNLKRFHVESQQLAESANIPLQFISQKKLGVGDQFKKLTDLKLVSCGQAGQIQHRKNQILIIFIWSTESSFANNCWLEFNKQIQIIKMTSENAIRIVGLTIQKDFKNVQNVFRQSKWPTIDVYCLQKQEEDNSLLQQLPQINFPFIIMINMQGRVHYLGSLLSINIQQKLNQINYLNQQLIQEKGKQLEQTVQIINKNMKVLKQAKLKDMLEKCSRIILKCMGCVSIENNQISAIFTIKATVFEEDVQIVSYLKNSYCQFNDIQINFKIKTIQIIKVPKAQNCTQCNAKLSEFYYWCYWSSGDDLRCRNCIQQVDSRGFYKFFENSILVNKQTKEIIKNSIGKNIQPKCQQGALYEGYMCNGCSQSPKSRTARYLSLGTIDEFEEFNAIQDLCQPCMINYMNNNEQVRNAISTNNNGFLRILYNVRGYCSY